MLQGWSSLPEEKVGQRGELSRRVACLSASGERETPLAPSLEASSERPNPRYASLPEEQRHPGAGGFVGSSAVEDDLAVARDFLMAPVKLVGDEAKGAGQGLGAGFELERMTQIHDDNVLARVELLL